MTPSSRNRLLVHATLAWACGLCVGYLFLGVTGFDDKYITYLASRELALGHGLVNVNGDHIEQSSTLIYTVLVALGWLVTGKKVDLATVGHLLSLLGGWLSLVLVGGLTDRLTRSRAGVVAIWLVGTSPIFIVWALSGMETTLECACFTALAWIAIEWLFGDPEVTSKRVVTSVVVLLAYELVRPEAPVVAVVTAAGLLVFVAITERQQARVAAVLLAACVVGLGLISLWRWSYFGALAPEPVYAKVRPSWSLFSDGLQYFYRNWQGISMPAMVLCLVVALRAVVTRRIDPLAVVALIASARIAFVLFAGGDWMAIGRFWVAPLGASCAVLVAVVTRSPRLAAGLRALPIAQLAILPFVPTRGIPPTAHYAPVTAPRSWFADQNCVQERDALLVDLLSPFIDQRLASRPGPVVFLTGQGGTAMYLFKDRFGDRIRMIDRNGLLTRDVRSCRITDESPRTALGRKLPYKLYLGQKDAIEEACGWPSPDIIFDPSSAFMNRLKAPQGGIKENPKPGRDILAAFAKHGYVEKEPLHASTPCESVPLYNVFVR